MKFLNYGLSQDSSVSRFSVQRVKNSFDILFFPKNNGVAPWVAYTDYPWRKDLLVNTQESQAQSLELSADVRNVLEAILNLDDSPLFAESEMIARSRLQNDAKILGQVCEQTYVLKMAPS